jgi:hypothetical protein
MRLLVNVAAAGFVVAMSLCCGRVAGEVGGASAAAASAGTRTSDRAVPPDAAAATSAPRTANEPHSPPMARRWRATKDVVAATVIRVSGMGAATPGPRLAGYLVRPSTKRPLRADDVAALVELIRSGTGFDDSVTKRCRPGTSVGFELSRKTQAGGDSGAGPGTELVLDFGCAKLTTVDTADPADLHTTYFDPARGAFVAFVKRVLPGDGEIQKLK